MNTQLGTCVAWCFFLKLVAKGGTFKRKLKKKKKKRKTLELIPLHQFNIISMKKCNLLPHWDGYKGWIK